MVVEGKEEETERAPSPSHFLGDVLFSVLFWGGLKRASRT